MSKKCPHCNETKGSEEFYLLTAGRSAGKLSSWCKSCMRQLGRKWHKNNAELASRRHKIWQSENREKHNEYKKKLYHTSEQIRIKSAFYSSCGKVLRGERNGNVWVKQTGFETKEEFIKYLESTIPTGYSLSDYGTKLCVDHIIPCSAFDLTDPIQKSKCFHYTNLRLVTKEENFKKGAKLLN